MKIVIFLLLISYIFTAPTTITLDLKESQSLTVGTAGSVIVEVTANEAITLTALSNILLKKSDDESTTISLTCTIGTPAANTVTEVTCSTAAPTTAGTYNLAADGTISMTATDSGSATVTVSPTVAASPKPLTVNSAGSPASPTAPTSVTLDLKESQSLTVGTAGSVIVEVTANEAITLTALSNILLKKSDDESTTISLTCTIGTPAANTVTEVTCSTAAPTTAGTYNLAADGTISMTATYGTDTPVAVVPTVVASPKTLTVNSAGSPDSPSSPTAPTSVTLDLKASQKLTTTDTSVILEVKANNAMSLSALTNLVLQSTETASTTFALTCTFSPAVSCAKDTVKEVTCKVAAPTTAGTYKLAVASGKSISMTATYGNNNAQVSGVVPVIAATPTSLTVSTASNNDNTNPDNSNDSENDDDNSLFLKFSYIMFFIAFLF